MRTHVIAAVVTVAVLASAGVSALGARTPGMSSAVTTAPASGELAELARTVESLRERVTTLESELARTRASAAIAPAVTAPFTVVNGAGTPIFTVSDGTYASSTRGRVHIGRGSSANYGMWFAKADGTLAAQIGESKTGPGVLIINRGATEVAEVTEDGFISRNSAGKTIAHIGPDPTNKARARMVLRGVLSITDENDVTVVDAGTLPDGRGAVRTWPNKECSSYGGLRSPNCLMGTAP
jgi:hypothetical protein